MFKIPKEIVKIKSKDWHLLEFSTPIIENAEVDNNFIIKGTAITETTTHNNHRYIAEELEKAAPGLIGRPLLVDHQNTVESIKGRVTESTFDSLSKSINFEANIMDPKIKQMVKDGRINSVSIGAFAEDLVKDEESDTLIAKGINIVELSLVAVPADDNANFAVAMAKNYDLKESSLSNEAKEVKTDKPLTERGNGEMTEKEKSLKELETKDSEIKALKEQVELFKKEKKEQIIKEHNELAKSKGLKEKDLSKMSEETILLLTEQLKELPVEKEVKVVEKKEMKAEVVADNKFDEFADIVVEKSGKGYAMWKMTPTINGS